MRAPEGEGQRQGGGEGVAGRVTEEGRGGTGKGSRCGAGKGQQKETTRWPSSDTAKVLMKKVAGLGG